MSRLKKRYLPPQPAPSAPNPYLVAEAAAHAMAEEDRRVREAATEAALNFKATGGVEHPLDTRLRLIEERLQAAEIRIGQLEAARS